MCGERDEWNTHLIAEYKRKHDNIARIVHLQLHQKFGLVGGVKWYNHKPASVAENDRSKYCEILISKKTISFNTEGLT